MKLWMKVSLALLIGLLVAGCAGTGASLGSEHQQESPYPVSAGPTD